MTTVASPDTGVVAGLQPSAGPSRAAWLDDVHNAGLGHVKRLGLPTRQLEDWKYLRVEALLADGVTAATPAAAAAVSPEDLNGLMPHLEGHRLVFINGYVAPEFTELGATLPDGVTIEAVSTLAAGTGDKLPEVLDGLVDPQGEPLDGFAALNAGLFDDGAVIRIPAHTTVDAPIHVVFVVTDDPDGVPAVVASPRSVVVAGPGSDVSIVETHIGTGTNANLSNAVTTVVAHPGATVQHLTVQDLPTTTSHLGVVHVHLADDATVHAHTVALGASIARHELRLHLEGNGATTSATGLYLPSGEQYHDNPVLVDHLGPNGTSSQIYNGVLDDRGHGVFNGRIVVHPTGAGADATQSNRNLVLSDRAEVDTRPRLEILADEVSCSHGATVGQLDEQAVHYLRSRGIPDAVARGMLTYAFANEMVRRARYPALIDWIHERVAQRFPGLDPTEVRLGDAASGPGATPPEA